MEVVETIENFSAPSGMVIREGKIFEAGDYPDKQFSLTPEELEKAALSFSPVDLDLEHRPTILDGKLGKLTEVKVKGKELFGKVELPEWLHAITKDDPLKVSCTWDRANKSLAKLALVLSPRVEDAALMAAFAEHTTRYGQQHLQDLHDTACRYGAVCKAEMASKSEANAIQKIHDAAVKEGAKCDTGQTSYPVYYGNKEEDSMTPEDVKRIVMEAISPLLPKPKPEEDEKPQPDFSEVERREEAIKTRERELLRTEAAMFADSLIADRRILPAQKPAVVASYVAIAEVPSEEKVIFSEDESKTATPIEAFKFSYQNAPQHGLQAEQTGRVLFDSQKDTENEVAERMKERARKHLGLSSEAK